MDRSLEPTGVQAGRGGEAPLPVEQDP
jgi:hypothetical protein